VLSPAGLAARDAVLRCWVREHAVPLSGNGLRVPLAGGGVVEADVAYRSVLGFHRFSSVRIGRSEVDAAALAAALVGTADGAADLVARVADSARRVERYATVPPGGAATPFLAAEQALMVGHLMHPAAKSRDGLSDAEDSRYAPELRGRFRLHWFAVDPAVLRSGSAVGDPVALMAELSGVDGDRPVLPAHPWQASDLMRRSGFRALLDSGSVVSLGEHGEEWFPTSSLRTVYRPDAAVMLKVSLGLRITNSRRENTLTELARGIEVNELLDAGIDAAVRESYPGFRVVRDPAYLAAVLPDGGPAHLDVSVREVPDGLGDARCLAGLVAPRPDPGSAEIVSIVDSLAAGRSRAAVACEWVRRYVVRVLGPMLVLYGSSGIGLEAHQQNTLVLLDNDGWPVDGWYRDNQGYYLAESRLPDVLRRTGKPDSTLALAPDAIVNDRLTYYLLLNQTLAPVATLGMAGAATEPELLGAVADGLRELRPDDTSGLAHRWLTAETLPCKANLATRLAGIDEVLAPVDNQSVYLTIPNPLRAAG
jgi:siderophore synthetase component